MSPAATRLVRDALAAGWTQTSAGPDGVGLHCHCNECSVFVASTGRVRYYYPPFCHERTCRSHAEARQVLGLDEEGAS